MENKIANTWANAAGFLIGTFEGFNLDEFSKKYNEGKEIGRECGHNICSSIGKGVGMSAGFLAGGIKGTADGIGEGFAEGGESGYNAGKAVGSVIGNSAINTIGFALGLLIGENSELDKIKAELKDSNSLGLDLIANLLNNLTRLQLNNDGYWDFANNTNPQEANENSQSDPKPDEESKQTKKYTIEVKHKTKLIKDPITKRYKLNHSYSVANWTDKNIKATVRT